VKVAPRIELGVGKSNLVRIRTREGMKHRDRVVLALNHEWPDRCFMQIAFTLEFESRLKAELDLKDSEFQHPRDGGKTYILERQLGDDLLVTRDGWVNSYYAETAETYTDEWGVLGRNVPYETL
jgi:hypothetical protein